MVEACKILILRKNAELWLSLKGISEAHYLHFKFRTDGLLLILEADLTFHGSI